MAGLSASMTARRLLKYDARYWPRDFRSQKSEVNGERRSAPGDFEQLLRVALTLDLNLRCRALDLGKISSGQLDVCRAEIFLEPMQFGCAGDRHDPWLLRK